MIVLPNGTRVVEYACELPKLSGHALYLDLETTSNNPKLDAKNPWHHCWVGGIAVTSDEVPGAWYIPVNHRHGRNVPREAVIDWLCDVLDAHTQWINHNIKYDAIVLGNDFELDFPGELVCTLTQAKIVDTDRMYKGGYGLDVLSRDWLNEEINPYEDRVHEALGDSKDYGDCPIDIMGEYAGQDVMTNRRLWRYIKWKMPEQCSRVALTERKLTKVLLKAERRGLCVDPTEVKIEQARTIYRMIQIEQKLEEIVGYCFRPHVNEDCYKVLCGTYGMPILGWTDTGNPSFDKDTLKLYPGVPNCPYEVVKLIQAYRKDHTYNSLFLEVFLNEHVNGVLHTEHNQIVRTGRMSAKKPNSQQFNARAKGLIHPHAGRSFLCADASQIEFRLIVHYINNLRAIRSYNLDPWTDFHQWVADLCEMARRPAKNVNFMMGYGGGKKKTVIMLKASEDVAPVIQAIIRKQIEAGEINEEQSIALFEAMAESRANHIFGTYHDRLPELKPTSKRAENAARARGYVYNLYGRYRHLETRQAHIAFNTLNQSSASDLVKEAMIELDEQVPEIDICTQVHDELVMEGDPSVVEDPAVIRRVLGILENPKIDLRVPIRWEYNTSTETWAKASKSKFESGWFHGTADDWSPPLNI